MGLVKFMDEAEAGTVSDNDYSFQIAASPDELTPQIAQGVVRHCLRSRKSGLRPLQQHRRSRARTRRQHSRRTVYMR